MSIASRITAITGHITDIYDTLELGGDTTQNKNIVNINTEIKREYKDFLANGTDTLWNNWEKVSGSGETLSLSPTIKGKMKVDLKGNTQQNGTPTPEAPVEVEVVSGDNTIKVEGKNLFDLTYMLSNQYNANGNSITAKYTLSNDVISISDSVSASGRYFFNKISLNTGTYTMSFKASLSGTDKNVRYSVRDMVNLTDVVSAKDITITNGNTYNFSFTLSETTTISISLQPKVNNGGTLSLSNLQLEKGSTASEFQPYQSTTYPISLGNIELCKIGTYQDSIVKDNSKWYLNKQIGKVVLNGTQTNNGYANYGNNKRFVIVPTNYTNEIYYNGSTPNALFSNITPDFNKVINNPASATEICSWCHSSGIMINITPSYNITNVSEMNSWLSNHNSTVYYVLKTPTYEEITDSSLKEQLNNLENAISYDSQTNISQTNDDLPFVLNVVALKEMS